MLQFDTFERLTKGFVFPSCSCHDIDEKFLIWHLTTNTHSITIVIHILIELTSNFVILL
jgi:heme A synthase